MTDHNVGKYVRPVLTPDDVEVLLRACRTQRVAHETPAAATTPDAFDRVRWRIDHVAGALDATKNSKPLLVWDRSTHNGFTETNAFEALLGSEQDGVRFRLVMYPTCYRRGPWRLTVDVLGGVHHYSWGCFDEADQPLRNFHDVNNAAAEAEAIAAVLLADRMEHGSIEGWVPRDG